jgi:decaprenyl-phosphate phosphoribosyltransferase
MPAEGTPQVVAEPAASPEERSTRARSHQPPLLRATRPRQWIKNLLVYAAPGAAGVVEHPGAFLRATAAFVVFTAVSAAMYLVNDVRDREADRLHPVKSRRPIASGAVTPSAAVTLASVLLVVGFAAAGALTWRLLVVVVIYAAITMAYSLRLKHVAVIELACVASGFILRAVAGGVAVGVPLSPWFLMVASFGAVFIVAGKRSSERVVMGEDRADHRASLGEYPAAFLRSVRVLGATVAIAAYCLWAFTARSAYELHAHHLIWFELSVVPFVLAMLIVELAFELGRGGEPEELALKNRWLQGLGLCWVALLLVGIYT